MLYNQLNFIYTSCKKDPALPVLLTGNISDITQTSAVSGGHTVSDNGASSISSPVTDPLRGVSVNGSPFTLRKKNFI